MGWHVIKYTRLVSTIIETVYYNSCLCEVNHTISISIYCKTKNKKIVSNYRVIYVPKNIVQYIIIAYTIRVKESK